MTDWRAMHRAGASRRAFALVVALACAGCDGGGVELLVDMKTDLVPGLEFARVRTEDTIGAGTPREATMAVLGDEDFIEGERIAEFRDLANGEALVRVSLIDRAGEVVLQRTAAARIERTYAMTLVLTRSCQEITCPEPGGDLELTSCSLGRCTSPACTTGAAECPAECGEDSECRASAACAIGKCIDGACFEAGIHERCQANEFCDPDVGCVPRLVLEDGAVCEASSETRCDDGEDEDCDGPPDCADPDCAARACDDGDSATTGETCAEDGICRGPPPDCDDDNACTTDTYDETLGCRHEPLEGPCDDGFYCNGTDACEAGVCSGHESAPCTGACTETDESCTPCLRDADCGAFVYEAWDACIFDACASDGDRRRRVLTPRCNAGACEVIESTEVGACSRDPEGAVCGDPTFGEWGPCESADVCATSGTQRRMVMDRICGSDGTCGSAMREETQACTRAVGNGTRCGPDAYDVCCDGACRNVHSNADCGGCGVACPGGTTCAGTGTGGYACRGCSSNAQCRSFLDGAATCHDLGAPPAFCLCQASCTACVAPDAGCGPGMYCHVVSGHNWCAPFP
jgi:hypothetical protein